MMEPGEAVNAYQVAFDALLDRRGDVVKADWTLQQAKDLFSSHLAKIDVVVIVHTDCQI